jgi:hypothetical protein
MITYDQKEKIKILDKLLSGIDTDTLKNILEEAKVVSILKNQSTDDTGIVQTLTQEIESQKLKIQHLETQLYGMQADIKTIVDIVTLPYSSKSSAISAIRSKYGVY